MVWGWGLGDLPWPPDIERGSGVAARSTVVVGCGRNGTAIRRGGGGCWLGRVGDGGKKWERLGRAVLRWRGSW
jgi:hypothetical protein